MLESSTFAVPNRLNADAPSWHVRLRAGDPPALDVVTGYGGRCEWARLFAVWREPIAGGSVDPAGYSRPPTFLPAQEAAVVVEFYPLPGVRVQWRVSIPRPEALAVQIIATNCRPEPLEIELFAVSALRLSPDSLPLLPSFAPLRIVRDVITGMAAPGLAVALGLCDSDACGLRTAWPPLWAEIGSGQGLGNIVTERPARERYAALAASPVFKPGESREIRLVQAAAATIDAAQEIAREMLHTP